MKLVDYKEHIEVNDFVNSGKSDYQVGAGYLASSAYLPYVLFPEFSSTTQ